MKNTNIKEVIVLSISIVLGITKLSVAQNPVESEYFKNPQLMVNFASDCANFWAKVHDDVYGGFFVEIGRQGNVLNYNKKSLVSQSRDAYGFSRAYMLTGNKTYLDMAASAIRFMRDHLYDKQYGGWYARSERDGKNPYTGNKSAFDHHYALLGLMANFEATGDTAVLHLLQKGYEFDETFFWDNHSTYYGYFNSINRNGTNATGKSFNSTVDAITTHLFNLYLITGEDKYAERLTQVAQNMLNYLKGNMANQVIGFPEEFNSYWEINTSDTRTIMGHVLKTGWCLARIYKVDPKEEYLVAAVNLVDHVLEKGYDHINGGPYKDYNRTTGVMLMYGAYDKAKAWWQMEQAITSGLILFEITGEAKYLKMADETLDFFMNYFVDSQYGEVYADRSETGGRVAYSGGYWDENKGSEYKAAYHSIETAYYSYMYGRMVVNNQSFTLNYNYKPLDSLRIFRMNPLEVDFDNFKIESVKLDGSDYTNFDANTRLLTIPALVGGEFAVTFNSTKNYSVGVDNILLSNEKPQFSIYPNPVVDRATFRINMPCTGSVSIRIFDLCGRLKEAVDSKDLIKGLHTIEWNSSSYAQGMYIAQLVANNQVVTIKLNVIK